MLVQNFNEDCTKYENFQIWDVDNMESFFAGNQVLEEVFSKDFKMSSKDLLAKRDSVAYTDLEIVERLLDQVGDKHFFTFTFHDKSHMDLIMMQKQKVMNFGINIEEVNAEHLYIIIMDKKPAYANN